MGFVGLLIFLFVFRVISVVFSTVRTVYTVKGNTTFAVISGFAETFIYYVAISDALKSDGNKIILGLAYAGGYAVGTWVGCIIAKIFIKTSVHVQIITQEGNKELIYKIREAGFGATSLTVYGKSSKDKKYLIFVETTNKEIDKLKKIIGENDPTAFVTVHENKEVLNGYFSQNIK